MFMNMLCAMHMMTTVPSIIWKCMTNIGMKNYENMWVLYVYEYIVCDEHDDCSALQSGRVLPPLLFWAIICLPVQIIQLKCSSCWGDGKQFWCIMIKKSHHTVPAQKSKISKQMIGGKVLNFFLCKDHKTTLIFARLSYYFTPYNRLTDDSLQTGSQAHKVVHASLGSLFGQQDLYFPANHWKLTDIFFPIWALWRRCAICCPQGIGLLRK